MTPIWSIKWSDGYDSAEHCVDHYSTEEKATEALAQLRRNMIAVTRTTYETLVAETMAGKPPWWDTEHPCDQSWVNSRIAEETEKFDREFSIVEHSLDRPTPNLENA